MSFRTMVSRIILPKNIVFMRLLLAAAILLSIPGFLPDAPVHAADLTIYVDTYEDKGELSECTPAPEDCSLRGAIHKANKRTGSDTIYLPAGIYGIYGDVNENKNVTGDLDVLSEGGSLTIIGEAPDVTTITANRQDRIFHMPEYDEYSVITLSLKNLTLREGNADIDTEGAAIKAYNSISLDNVIVEDNVARLGGALFIRLPANGKLSIRNSMFRNNVSKSHGGAIYVTGQAVEITNSTFDSNRAYSNGGAVFNNASILDITASTFKANMASLGGGIYVDAFLGDNFLTTITNATFAENSKAIYNRANAAFGALTSSEVLLRNTILSGGSGELCQYDFERDKVTVPLEVFTFTYDNKIPVPPALIPYVLSNTPVPYALFDGEVPRTYLIGCVGDAMSRGLARLRDEAENCYNDGVRDGIATITDEGGNIDSSNSCGLSSKNGSMIYTNPQLESLQNNGGPVDTVALKAESPAVNKGNPRYCTGRDQRGLSAVGVCDSGAYEYAAFPILSPTGGVDKSAKIGRVLGSPLNLSAVNALGNALEGWQFIFDVADGPIDLGSPRGMTDARGFLTNAAAINNGTSGPYIITATAGIFSAKFSISSAQSIAASKSAKVAVPASSGSSSSPVLPSTGFAPGVVTTLEAQPKEKTYTAQDDMTLNIPRLGVQTSVLGIPAEGDGWDLSWLWDKAGYLEGTAFPTQPGNSALTGHVYLPNGKPGPFEKLHTLVYGDQVVVQAWGKRYIYEVRSSEQVSPSNTSVLKSTAAGTWLTLITCRNYDAARGVYVSRQVVKAVLLRIE